MSGSNVIETSPSDVRVDGLFCYPVKSFRAVSLHAAHIAITGVSHDRQWMVVDTRTSPERFVTQREAPALATVKAMIDGDLLLLSCASLAELRVSAPPPHALRRVKVWGSELIALDAGDEAAAWIGRVLDAPPHRYRLVKFHPEQRRECSARYAGDSGAHTFFADGYPVLLANVSSLDALNSRMGRTAENAMPMNRFRPNLVLAGLPAWDEDHVETVAIGEVLLRLVKPCVRCEITTTHQDSGARLSDEPLATLARFRNNPDLGGVTFGWNAVVVREGAVKRGDVCAVEYRF
ncbi:MAG: MOSC domain-containing protein [Burkholderiales bacterium]|nr:MAG: MOSC domain-containing protein [Betaproteobacteria bacterium]TAG84365.1 MAG: MOSC domain-containing protein [Burkholderiales bacterium]